MFVKSKAEPLLPTLTKTCAGLACYGFLNLVKVRFSTTYFLQVDYSHGYTKHL